MEQRAGLSRAPALSEVAGEWANKKGWPLVVAGQGSGCDEPE